MTHLSGSKRIPAIALIALLFSFGARAEDPVFRFAPGPVPPAALLEGGAGRSAGDLLAVDADGTVHRLPARDTAWSEAGRLDIPPGQIETAETTQGLIAITGEPFSSANRLRMEGGALRIDPLPALPFALEGVRCVGIGSRVYLVGYRPDAPDAEQARVFLVLDAASTNPQWTALRAWPGPARRSPALAAQQGQLFMTGGMSADPADGALSDHWRFDPNRDEWTALKPAPEPVAGNRAVGCGLTHILLSGGAESEGSLRGYHLLLDVWVDFPEQPLEGPWLGAFSDDTRFTLIGQHGTVLGEAVLVPTKYGWLDNGVVLLYVVVMLAVGAFLSKREKGSQDYFRGGQRIPWWASGLSLFATGASAISLMAMPGKSFGEDWTYFTISIYTVMLLPIVLFVYVPIARRLKVATANEYLERRFNVGIRLFASVIFALNQMLARMAAIMLLPAIAISSIAGIPMEQSILIMGIVTTFYVTMGGLEAVVWTDVIQALVMILSVGACIVWALMLMNTDAATGMQILSDQGKLQMFDMRFDLAQPVAYIMFANIFMVTLSMIGDQNFIQRVQCTRDETTARKAVITQMTVAVPLNFVLFSLGTILFLFYRERPELLSPALKTDGIFPLFAAQMLPPGIAGLVIASLLAATMSTLSSAVNSVANVGVEDFYRRMSKKATDHRVLVLGRTLSVALGIFGTVAALILARTPLTSVWDLAILVTGIIAAPIAGIFTLGIFTRRANSTGVLIGSVAGVAASIYARYGMSVHPLFNLVAGVAVCLIVGYIASLLIPSRARDLSGLTAFTMGPRTET